MKRKLHYFALILLFSVFSASAQKTWNFSGTDLATWPVTSSSIPNPTVNREAVHDQLYIYSGTTSSGGVVSNIVNMGAVNTNNAAFSDGFTSSHRFQLGNAGYTGGIFTFMPTQRFVSIIPDGAGTLKIWFRSGSNGATRTLYVTDGSKILGQATTNNGTNGDTAILTATIETAGKIYIYGDTANNLVKMELTGTTVTTPTLGTNDFHVDAISNVFSNGKLVFVSNVKSDTQVDVYGISGVLVKSLTTSSDTSFDLNTGIYIIRSKSAEGQKTAKVLVN